MNESGWQNGRSPDSRSNIQSYILTCSRLIKVEALTAVGSHQGGLHFCIRGTPPRMRSLGKNLKLNESGKVETWWVGSPVSRHSIQSYTITCYRLRKRELLIALGSHQGSLNFCICGTPSQVRLVGLGSNHFVELGEVGFFHLASLFDGSRKRHQGSTRELWRCISSHQTLQ